MYRPHPRARLSAHRPSLDVIQNTIPAAKSVESSSCSSRARGGTFSRSWEPAREGSWDPLLMVISCPSEGCRSDLYMERTATAGVGRLVGRQWTLARRLDFVKLDGRDRMPPRSTLYRSGVGWWTWRRCSLQGPQARTWTDPCSRAAVRLFCVTCENNLVLISRGLIGLAGR